MSISKDSYSYTYGEDSSFSYTHTCSGSDIGLLVGVSHIPTNDIASVKYNGTDLEQVGRARIEDDSSQQAWFLANPDEGSHTLEVNFSGTVRAVVTSISYNGIKQTDSVYKVRSGVGKDVQELPLKSFSKVSGIAIGLGITDNENSYVSSLTPQQTEEWNILGSGLGIRAQALSAQLPVTLNEISVDNTLTEKADWAIVIVGLEGA